MALLVFWTVMMFFLLFSKQTPGKSLLMIPGMDKVAHFCLFTGWSFLFFLGFAQYFRKSILWALILSVAFAASTEIIQLFIPHRDADWLDGLADLFGSCLGIFSALFIKKELNRMGKEF